MSLKDSCNSPWEILPATIANGASLTGTLDLGGLRLFGIVMPSGWTAADLTFQMSPDAGAAWADLKNQDGAEITVTASAGGCFVLDPAQFSSLQYLRVRSGAAASPVAQGADRQLRLVLRSV